ncbi:MAG: haloalkane dehalogenase [Alphaproteobacteria bacterium]|nr:haloalkane dehalogenase [Alphaproteobacteria bacterium]MCZ6840487.1 haloalkane dehalogenase [Alphaproteobacteria bacterium]
MSVPAAILPTPDPAQTLSTENPSLRKTVKVADAEMAYIDIGEGEPIVFLHGNPTSSFLWRDVIPHVEGLGRIVAPDFIAHGHSSTSPRDAYRFKDNVAYFDAFFEALGLAENVILVLHDWGAAVGFYRAARFPQQISGIAYMEAMVWPRHWSDMPPERVETFKWLRTPEGEREALEGNIFVETMLFERGIIRDLSEVEKEVYRYPTTRPGGTKLPGVIMPNDIPFDGEPADNHKLVAFYSDWLKNSDVPKLFINADEGHGLAGAARDFARTFKNQTEITVHARHYLQEDAPDEAGAAIADFVRSVRQ